MGLSKYHAKRNFRKTDEPKGKEASSRGKQLRFVVQQHNASRMHYDVRLELDGVLKSWAVPKGPSMNPHDKHLAVYVEDHPLEYRKFEGVIPKGNYGAGEVIIWDEGTYTPYDPDEKDPQKTLQAGLKKGHLTFILHGQKLRGEFALIKMHGQDEDAWLMVKKDDEFADEKNDVLKKNTSIKSDKRVDEIGNDDPIPDLTGYPKSRATWKAKPMLSTLADAPFDDKDWIFEVKWDGYRAIATKSSKKIELYSRNDIDFREKYPAVTEALRQLEHEVILDGEIVVLDAEGIPHFEQIQNWQRDKNGELFYYAFDILWCDGHDVRTMPLSDRKRLLRSILPQNSSIRYGDYIAGEGKQLFEEMKRRGLEGVMAKRAESMYREDIRGRDWLKIKTHQRQEVVIGGFTEPRGGRKYLGALVVGVYQDGDFVYVGHSGGGIADKERKELQRKLTAIERKISPFKQPPKPNAPVHWVRPRFVCEMSFTEWTSDGSMRHPKYEGLREDKNPKEVHREPLRSSQKVKKEAEKEAPMTQAKQVTFTHLDKVFFPKHKYTKKDILEYYQSVEEYILPYMKDRPISMLRQPDGIDGMAFFQKNNEHLPEWVPHADIYSDSNEKDLRWIVGGKKETLAYLVQLGCIEINPWNSRVRQLDKPDWLVMDLDPEGVDFKKVVQIAKTVKKVCDEWKVAAYVKTSGKRGIHIYIPLGAKYDYEQAKNFAHLIGTEVNSREPKLTSLERLPKKRQHKIYLDYLQNREGQTLAAPYSLRPTPGATVATPLHWDEVNASLDPKNYTIKNIHRRLGQVGDLWKPVLSEGIDLKKILQHFE